MFEVNAIEDALLLLFLLGCTIYTDDLNKCKRKRTSSNANTHARSLSLVSLRRIGAGASAVGGHVPLRGLARKARASAARVA